MITFVDELKQSGDLRVSSLGKVQRLSWHERRLLAQALVLLPLTFFGVYAVGVKRWQRVLNRLSPFREVSGPNSNVPRKPNPGGRHSTKHSIAPRNDHAASERARAIARMVRIAAEHGVYRANCLQQSLVLSCLLRSESIESEIRFGARKEGSQLQAHAWVECFGVAINEEDDGCQRFFPFEWVAVRNRPETDQ